LSWRRAGSCGLRHQPKVSDAVAFLSNGLTATPARSTEKRDLEDDIAQQEIGIAAQDPSPWVPQRGESSVTDAGYRAHSPSHEMPGCGATHSSIGTDRVRRAFCIGLRKPPS
jgi:hypothetical protein